MEIREARPSDRPAIRDVARRSMQASYSLDPTAIVVAVEEWYDENQHVVYTGRKREEIYGYWCSRCETFANAMDAMGRPGPIRPAATPRCSIPRSQRC